MTKLCVLCVGNISVAALNHLIETARRLNLGAIVRAYSEPVMHPAPRGHVFSEWGIICERGIVCSRSSTDGHDEVINKATYRERGGAL